MLKHPKLITYFDFIENANIAPIENDDLYSPKNIMTSTCLAINSSGNSEWPPKILLHCHYALVGAIEVLCHSSVLEYRSIDKLLTYGSFEHMENLLMFLSGNCQILSTSRNLGKVVELIKGSTTTVFEECFHFFPSYGKLSLLYDFLKVV